LKFIGFIARVLGVFTTVLFKKKIIHGHCKDLQYSRAERSAPRRDDAYSTQSITVKEYIFITFDAVWEVIFNINIM
jgi:hypothetical protein